MKGQRVKRLHTLKIGLTAAILLSAIPALAHEGHHHSAMGTVKALDTTRLDLETKDGKLETFVLTDATAYKRTDTPAKREDIRIGERAVVMYEMKEGRKLALEVRLGAAKPNG